MPVLLVDAGNFLVPNEEREFSPWEKNEFMFDMMGRIQYDAVTPGDLELLYGIDAIKGLYSRQPGIQVVSANIQDRSGNLVWPAYTVIEKGGFRYGVTGVTGAAFYTFNVKRGIQKADEFTLTDTKEALAKVVPELREQSDLVVVLLHEGPGDARRLAEEVEGIDVVVVGHNPGYMFNPDRVGNTLLLRGGNRGQYLSILELTLDETKSRIIDYNGEGKPLDEGVAKDTEIEPVVKTWEDDYKDREQKAKRTAAAEKAALQGTEKFLGAEICARCHVEQYARWSETPHARAFQTLVEAEKETDDDCLECHVVGYNEPTGYAVDWLQDKMGRPVTATDNASLRNVQCESCHGMGTYHGTNLMMKVPEEETCRNCHQGDFDKGFDYQEALTSGKIH
jgi:hypothetical protein